ncbi:hypothetical protein [Streptomyces sp. NBC_01477]|uniref:pPIWI_RE_Y domain-containing protein n=1 Tax=Streptomyces sp. NBC_01477 TaxID=2976015 RepID=UPI002E304876|nr:hypothetical protein [Streptomyces sp. NBC_01477]
MTTATASPRPEGVDTAGPGIPEREDAGTRLYRELSRIVVALADHGGLRSFTLPYPPAAQSVLDRVVLHCLHAGEAPPKSLPELLKWCRHRSARDRPFTVPPTLLTPASTLVHPIGLAPTRTCLELASAGPGGGAETTALGLLAELETRCGSAERYRRCRQFLAHKVMVHQDDRFKHGWSNAVWSRVRDLYHPVPEALVVEGTLLRCAGCRLPARLRGRKAPEHGALYSGANTWCESEECPHGVSLELIRDPGRLRMLRRPLRAFVALPLRVEEAALAELDRFGVGYEALPGGLNAYRLLGAGRRVRSLHAYDRLQPALLAARLASRTAGIADGTAVVVPRRLADRTGYRAAFTAALPEVVRPHVLLTTPEELVRDLAAVPPQATWSTGSPGQEGAATAPETNGDADA